MRWTYRDGVVLGIVTALLSVLLAIAVNIATGGTLPGPLAPLSRYAWPAVGLISVIWIAGVVRQIVVAERRGAMRDEATGRPGQLPAAPALVGREAEVRLALSAVKADATVVLISAAPGTGKTTLALHLAHRLRRQFPDGQLYAYLRGAQADPAEPATVLAEFLDALGQPVRERSGTVDQLAARFRSAVVDRRVLVVLDDVRDSAQVAPLLPGGAGCLTLVTSRQVLAGLDGAVVVPLGPLPDDGALAVLRAHVGADRIAADPVGTRRIIAACAGLPLALRLAAGRLRQLPEWTASMLADRLADEALRLGELRLGDQAVRSVFRTAYNGLGETERLVLRRAGSYPGRMFDLHIAAARCGLPAALTGAALDRLADAHLLTVPAPDRYQVHDLVRLFARELLTGTEPADERRACVTRSAALAVARAAAMAPAGTPQPEDLPLDLDDALGVAHEAIDVGAYESAWTIVDAVHRISRHTHQLRWALWEAGVRAAAGLDDDRLRVRALRWLSHAHSMNGDLRRCLPPAEQAVQLSERLADPRELAQSLQRVGEVYRDAWQYAKAERALQRALDLFTTMGAVDDQIEVLSALGTLYNNHWRHELSIPVLERAATLLTSGHSDSHRGWIHLALGLAYRFDGRPEVGEAHTEEAFAAAHRAGDDYLVGYCLQERAWAAEGQGRLADAEHDFSAMLQTFTRINNAAGAANALAGLATIAERSGRYADALAGYAAAIAEYERLGASVQAGRVYLSRAVVLREVGRNTDAAADARTGHALIGDAPVALAPPQAALLAALRAGDDDL
jgi:tetratricopeptide (TPR) repeat protein